MSKASQIAAIKAIADEFLLFTYADVTPLPSELETRHNRIKAAVEKCGGSLDAWGIARLFGELESIAGDQIYKVAALAQTTDPDAMSKYGLPKNLIGNAVALQQHNETQGKVKSAANARRSSDTAKHKAEFIKWAKSISEPPKNMQAECLRRMEGYKSEWGEADKTIKSWWKIAHPHYVFKHGRQKKK